MYHWVKDNLNFDQLIWEFGDDDNPDWVHISYVSEEDNRRRCLKAYKSKDDFLVSKNEGIFIRNYRLKNIKKKLFK